MEPALYRYSVKPSFPDVTMNFSGGASSLYVIFCPFYLPQQVDTLKANLQEDKKAPIISSVITLVDTPINLAYSVSWIATLSIFASRLTSTISQVTPILGIAFNAIELVKDVFNSYHLYSLSKELRLLTNDDASDFEKLKEKLETNAHYHQFFGRKNLKHLSKLFKEPNSNHAEIKTLVDAQIKKAFIIQVISISCLALAIIGLACSMVFAPFAVVLVVSFGTTLISFARTVLIPAYLYQPGHKFKPSAVIPLWCKKIPSRIVKLCSGPSSRSSSFSTRSHRLSNRRPQRACKCSCRHASNQSTTRLPSSQPSFSPVSITQASVKQPLPRSSSIPSYFA